MTRPVIRERFGTIYRLAHARAVLAGAHPDDDPTPQPAAHPLANRWLSLSALTTLIASTTETLGLDTPGEVSDDSFALIDEALSAPADQAVQNALNNFVRGLNDHGEAELLIGFPTAPFILPLHTTNRTGFLDYASRNPAHPIRIRRTGGYGGSEWLITPRDGDADSYRLTFTLPQHIEDWIVSAGEDE
ncbi:hypothetical protein ACIHEJ_10705 [Streptomyces sp. NPDC052301]|uniref:hypothetical protein n=1 Tax=Streptomyces sp. NPDC052301 TaxID=3365687 RepID=UPI0037CCC9A9